MKPRVRFALSICILVLILGACSSADPRSKTNPNSQKLPDPASASVSLPDEPSRNGIDVDQTVLSSTLVYAEVYRMVTEPKAYIGKTIKMDGLFAYAQDSSTGKYYFACINQDATACCAQGIEFILAGDHTFPDDYPKEGEKITVTGVFDTYMEGQYTYCTLRNATLSE